MANAVKMKLVELASCSESHKELVIRYSQLLSELFAGECDDQMLDGLQYFIRHMVNENVSLVVSRQLVAELCSYTSRLPDPLALQVARFTLTAVQPRAISFEEQLAAVRQHLAGIYERQQQWREAATTLVGIPLETGQKQYSLEYRLQTYIKIARLFLEDDDPVSAETYITRASVLQAESQSEQLVVLYKVCYARVLDHRRKFLEAGQRYLELSYRSIVDRHEQVTALKNAVVCTILASAGRMRSKILAALYKDERCQSLAAFSVLEKMYLDRIIERRDVVHLQSLLLPHQQATTSDGQSLLQRALVEHNILSASKIYSNISLVSLATLLDVTPERAEKTAAHMLAERRLAGRIDQIAGVLHFDVSGGAPDASGSKYDGSGGKVDACGGDDCEQHIERVCGRLNSLVERIAAVSPDWFARVLAENGNETEARGAGDGERQAECEGRLLGVVSASDGSSAADLMSACD